MKKLGSLLLMHVTAIASVCAQDSPDWIFADTTSSVDGKSIVINRDMNTIHILGSSVDMDCSQDAVTIFSLSSSGNLVSDTLYTLDSCAAEYAEAIVSNRVTTSIYLFALHNRNFPSDSLFLYSADVNGSLSAPQYCGETMRAEPIYYEGSYYFSSNDAGNGNAVYKLDESGAVSLLNSITDSYFTQAPRYICAGSGRIFEFETSALISDSSWVCYVFDTTGLSVDSFVFDANPNANEALYYVETDGNVLFNMTVDLSLNVTYPSCVDFNGNLVWSDTLPFEGLVSGGACVDTVNNFGFVLCRVTGYQYRIYSYDLATGIIQNSTTIDSVWYSLGKVKIMSGPSGGVFMTYRKWGSNEMMVLQFDQYLNLLWSGTAINPNCAVPSYPVDVAFDSLGSLYILGQSTPCGVRYFVAKFTPSLVGVGETYLSAEYKIYPTPATYSFNVEFADDVHGIYTIVIFDITGNVVGTRRSSESRIVIPTDGWSNGVYFIQVISQDGESTVFKQIIQR
jgi:hypothetical protein